MNRIQLTNSRNQTLIAENVGLANNFWLRLRGLLGRPVLQEGEGLWLIPCRQVHMHGMKYPLSIWFLDQDDRVCYIIDNLEPNKVSPLIKKAKSVLEFPAGWGKKIGIEIGDLVLRSDIYP
jgi:uncharacterized protein